MFGALSGVDKIVLFRKELAMTKVVVDATLRSKLHGLAEPLELCDESGDVLGHVFPTGERKEAAMTRVVVDAGLRRQLHDLTEPLELCDESGEVLGRILPTVDLSQYEPWEPPISEEELRGQGQSEKW